MNYKIIVNEQFEFEDIPADKLDVIRETDGSYHLLLGHTSHRASIRGFDPDRRLITVELNGRTFQVRLDDAYDQLVDQLGLKKVSRHRAKDIKAPMPGLVLKIEVTGGQSVSAGDPLVILEAMKMENVIKADADGTIKSIRAEEGQAVDKGQLLIEME
ncbi:MAG: biotin/lipoyl-containing protein [Saprospiraceae bacterium]|nr:biotin/lipoyl-binding protein [Lewinella sp.]